MLSNFFIAIDIGSNEMSYNIQALIITLQTKQPKVCAYIANL